MKVLDNLVSKSFQNKIENYLLNNNFPWFYQKESLQSSMPKKYKIQTKDTFNEFQMCHKFIDKGKINSQHIEIIVELLKELKMETSQILRCKANLKFKTTTNKKHNIFHIDNPNSHKVLIYYVNDSDGDTVFFDEDLNIKKKITPKMGNMVLFNGNSPHAASHPIKSHRYIISYTFLYKNFK